MKKLLSLFTALLLCTAMWGATTNQTLYKVEGALYQGLDVSFKGGTKLFVPNGGDVTFTSFDGEKADWYIKSEKMESDVPSYTRKNMNDGNYAGVGIRNYTDYDKINVNYVYGSLSETAASLYTGTGTMNMMSMANAYSCTVENTSDPTKIGAAVVDNKMAPGDEDYISKYETFMKYGTKTTIKDYGGKVEAYEMIMDNPGEMYIEYVVLPIFGYPKDETKDGAKIEHMIPEGKNVTLELYPLSEISKDADGKYSYTKESTPIATKTVDNGAYTKDATSGYGYRGTLKFELDEPILMTTSFVARLTWGEGCDFGLITDSKSLQNYTTWYIIDGEKYYYWKGGGSNASISYYAMFPTLETKDESTELTIPSTGTTEKTEKISFRSNINPTFNDFTIGVTDDSWINMNIEKKNITYSGTTYKQSGTNYITFNVTATPNTTGKTREATITLKHHGKVLTYTVKQAPMISIKNSESKEISALSLKLGDTEILTATVSPDAPDQTEIKWSSFDNNIATVDADGKVTAKALGTATIRATSKADDNIYAECKVTVAQLTPINVPDSKLTAPSVGGDVCFDDEITPKQLEIELSGTTFKSDDWTVTTPTWVEATYKESTELTNHILFKFTADKNSSGSKRQENIKIEAYGHIFEYPIYQAPMINQIILSPKITLAKGSTKDLSADISIQPFGTDQTGITWSSNNTVVATVNETTGEVTAKTLGNATITATSVANPAVTAICEVTVCGIEPVNPMTTPLEAPAAGGDIEVAFTLSGVDFVQNNWLVTEKPEWISKTAFTSQKDENSTTVTCTLTADPNATGKKQDGTIKIKAAEGEFSYSITQEPMQSAFYNLPEGAFVQGMNENGRLIPGAIYLPYSTKPHVFSSVDGAGDWWSNGNPQKTNQAYYSYPNLPMKSSYTIPQLRQNGKVNYQYGADSEDYKVRYFYVANSDMQYMTPAKLWGDLVQNPIGQALGLLTLQSVMGVYFNNTDVMYIDGISIPISAGSDEEDKQKTKDDLFGENASVTVTIYHAKIEGDNKSFERTLDNTVWSGTLTDEDVVFTPLSETESYRGALNATFAPIHIEGPFVVELSDMSGCAFKIYASKERPGCNKWGYYLKSDVETPTDDYTPAISVHAMFPALYPKDGESLDVEIPAKGSTFGAADCPTRTVYANYKYEKDKNGWSRTASKTGVITMSFRTADQTDKSTEWYFIMDENKTKEERKVDVTFTFRGKTLTYHVTQLAPEPTAYIRTVTSGKWGTICLPYAAASFSGAEMYSIAGKMEGDKGIYLDQVNEMEAGEPYIFRATDDKIEVKYYAIGDPQAANENAKGLCGYIGESEESYITVPDDGNSYIVYQNTLYLVNSENVTIASNRAYIKYNKVGTPSPAPHVHRVAMPISGAPTSMLQVNEAQPAVKILRDGHIVILRADKEYNILGQSK